MNTTMNRRQWNASALGAVGALGSLGLGWSPAARAQHWAPAEGSAPPLSRSQVNTPAWALNTSLYQVNVRQYSQAGTLAAVAADLPRIAALGVGIVWFMPFQPIGKLKRKGSLGSYYSIARYTGVDPEFGTVADFKALVQRAHGLGLKVMMDWVPNHTAWDHPWIEQHPEWYRKGADGRITAVKANPSDPADPEVWEDVAWLDFNQRALWDAQRDAMQFWQRECQVDGFRCDVAWGLPVAFWDWLRPELERVRPVLMLAEADQPVLHARAFDLTYDWKLNGLLMDIAKGKSDARDVQQWWLDRMKRYPKGAMGLNFTSNHDINSWHGSDTELYGSSRTLQALQVLATTLPGMPLIYNGQEAGLAKRLEFFEKDPIAWGRRPLEPFFKQITVQKRGQGAFHGPLEWDALEWLPATTHQLLVFRRQHRGKKAVVSVNLSAQPQKAQGKTLAPWAWSIR